MVVYSYLREYDGVHCGVIMNTVIPGVFPWQKVLANPYLWHFAFHSIPDLPETLVANHVDAYFDYFYDAISADPSAITAEARKAYAASYKRPEALAQGFAFYRGLWGDADRNARDLKEISTPVLYLRGERKGVRSATTRRGCTRPASGISLQRPSPERGTTLPKRLRPRCGPP